MDKDIKKSISATDKDAQYDEKAKNLLGHKIILAHILRSEEHTSELQSR